MAGRSGAVLPLAIALATVLAWYGLSLLVDNPYYRLLMVLIPIWASFAMSWNLFSGYSGLISFGHAAFFGLGAYTVGLLLVTYELTPWAGVPLGALVGAAAGAAIGYPTFRLKGLYFALAMLAYPLSLVYVFEWLGYQEVTLPMQRQHGAWYMQFEGYVGNLVLALALLLLCAVISIVVERSRFGMSLRAIKQNELAAEAAGVDTFRWKLRAMVLSGALAATAGGLYATVVLVLTPGSVFGMVVSAQAIILTLFGGVGIVWGPLIGAVTLLPLSETLQAELGSILPGIQGLLYGMVIILVILLAPEGIYWKIRDALAGTTARSDEATVADATAADATAAGAMAASAKAAAGDVPGANAPRRNPARGDMLLSVRGLSKSYGGLKAVSDVGFEVRAGEIVGIIGPNGAGKTTLFNLLNGIVTPDSGEIVLDGRRIDGLKPNEVCRLGIGRTFQVVRAFQRMDVLGNVVIGAYARAGSEGEAWRLAGEAVEAVGLGARAGAPASSLTSLELRLMELARALASGPRLVLLDEPLAGLGAGETATLMSVVEGLPDRGVTVVIIEHTISAMVGLVDRMVVLDHGALLTEGVPDEVTRSPAVIEAYLGSKWAARNA